MSGYLRYPWQELYLLAMAELDPKSFMSKAFTARTAIANRIKIVGTLDAPEREAIDDALTGLSMMNGAKDLRQLASQPGFDSQEWTPNYASIRAN